MKKILLLATLLVSFTSLSQYEDEIKTLQTICHTPESSIGYLFPEHNDLSSDSLYMYENEVGYYVIEYSDIVIASYVEEYSKDRLQNMNKAIRGASNEYYYLVSGFKDDNNVLITISPK